MCSTGPSDGLSVTPRVGQEDVRARTTTYSWTLQPRTYCRQGLHDGWDRSVNWVREAKFVGDDDG
jgi:hypothetical protein